MRNPERIDKILEIIGKIWKQNPDLRLCQIICNSIDDFDPYYIEDDTLVQKLIDNLCVNTNNPTNELQALLDQISVFEDNDYFDSL
jgi:hypothetical protein